MTQNLAHWLHSSGHPAAAAPRELPEPDAADLGTAFGLDVSLLEAIHAEEARRREGNAVPGAIDRDC